MDDYVEKYLINNIHDSLEFKDPLLCQGLTGYYTSMGVTQYCHSVIISPVHVEGDLIVHTCLQFGLHGLSRLFSLNPRKIRHPWSQSGVLAELVAFYYAFQVYNPQCIWSHFCGTSYFTKNMRVTLRTQVTRASKIWLWIFNACFTQITSSKIERSFGFDWFFFLFGVFDFVRLSKLIELNLWIEFDWARLKFSSIRFDLLRRA